MIHTHTFEVGGKTLSLETGRVAKQAGGSVLLGMGETVILATATMSKTAREGIDFLPLVCDFEERKYAVGKIPGGFIKRGGRPSDKAVLISRLIDRPIRPLFPKGMRNDVQVITMAFSVDPSVPHDVLAITAAGAALAISDVPFNGPIAGVRVGRIDGKFVLFPSNKDLESSDLDLVVAGHKGAISMVEAGAVEVDEQVVAEALSFAHKAIQVICKELEAFAKVAGKSKNEPILAKPKEELVSAILSKEAAYIGKAIFDPDKAKRESAMDDLAKELVARYSETYADDPETRKMLPDAVDAAVKRTIRKFIIEEGKRPDGRGTKEVRELSAETGLLPRVHGSGLFTRGQTQVMTVATLGMPKDAQIMDTLDVDETDKRFMHFYNFPPYSVGEVRMLRGAGRREIGHGALAERALKPMVPLDDPDFPYTVYVISEVLESNGSTSMASVCGATLALLDAGVPIKAPVAGIAMGLMSEGDKFVVLTDIQGVEDFCGDMDFKVAGTRKGITALQLDTKLEGIPDHVLTSALQQAKEARMKLLDVIDEAVPEPRIGLSPNAPRLHTVQILQEKIGALIGPGGSNIRRITEETGTDIDIQQDGRVLIAAANDEVLQAAISQIRAITASLEVGMEFRGPVTRLMGRGAMVEVLPGKEGLVPTELLLGKRIRRPDDAVSVGDVINVKVHEIDAMGRVNLTAVGLNPQHPRLSGQEHVEEGEPRFDRGDRGGRGGDRGGDRGGRGDRGRDRYGRDDRNRDRAPYRPDSASSQDVRYVPPQETEPAQATEAPKAPEAPAAPEPDDEGFPRRQRDDEDVNARFRPRR